MASRESSRQPEVDLVSLGRMILERLTLAVVAFIFIFAPDFLIKWFFSGLTEAIVLGVITFFVSTPSRAEAGA